MCTPSGQTPPGQTPPLGRHPRADTPLGRHPHADTPQADPPRQTPLLADTPSGRHPFWQTPLLADTPSGRHPPGRHPLGRHPPNPTHRRLLQRTVRILLECILVCSDFSVFLFERTFLIGVLLTFYPSLPENRQHPLFNKRHDSEYRKKTRLENCHQSRTCLRI